MMSFHVQMRSHGLNVIMHAAEVPHSSVLCALCSTTINHLKAVQAAALQRACLPCADVAVAAAKKDAAVGSTASQSSASGKLTTFSHMPDAFC